MLGSQHVYPVDAARSEVGHRGKPHRASLSRVLGLAGLTWVLGLAWLGLVLWSQELGRLGPAGGFFGEVGTPSAYKECFITWVLSYQSLVKLQCCGDAKQTDETMRR